MNHAESKVSSKGQITIPSSIREALGLNEGDRVDFYLKPGSRTVEMVARNRSLSDLREALKDMRPVDPLTPEAIDHAIAQHVSDDHDSGCWCPDSIRRFVRTVATHNGATQRAQSCRGRRSDTALAARSPDASTEQPNAAGRRSTDATDAWWASTATGPATSIAAWYAASSRAAGTAGTSTSASATAHATDASNECTRCPTAATIGLTRATTQSRDSPWWSALHRSPSIPSTKHVAPTRCGCCNDRWTHDRRTGWTSIDGCSARPAFHPRRAYADESNPAAESSRQP